jgi:hypothetical protein
VITTESTIVKERLRELLRKDLPLDKYVDEIEAFVRAERTRFAERALKQVVSAYQHPNMPTFIATAMIPKRSGLFGLGYRS